MHRAATAKAICTKGISTCVFLLLLAVPQAQANAGLVNFKNMTEQYGSAKVNLDLNRELLLMTALLSGNTDPELQAILRKLDLVKIRVYNIAGQAAKAQASIDEHATAFIASNWHSVINRDEDGDLLRILTQSKDQLIEGVVVMKLDREEGAGELAFINIVGEINPTQVRKVAESLNFNFGF